jgi:hypothetical protein
MMSISGVRRRSSEIDDPASSLIGFLDGMPNEIVERGVHVRQ